MNEFESFIKLENKEEAIASLKNIGTEVQEEVVKKLADAGGQVKESLRSSLIEATPDAHSAPGGIPYSQTGILKSKIQAKVEPLMIGEPITLKIFVSKKGFYGRMLEFGTSKMAARPWFYSGITAMFPFLREQVETAKQTIIERRNAKKR